MKRDDYVPSDLADVQATPAAPATTDTPGEGEGDAWTLVFVRNLDHVPTVVWEALTEPAQLDEWAPFRADRDLDAIGPATLTMIDGPTEVPLGATVRHADEPMLLEYTWGDDVLRWELSATDGGTRLTLRHTTAKRSAVPMVAAGWHMCLDVMALALDRHPIGAIRGGEALDFGWQKLHDAYAEKLGITAAAPTAE
jgi:uncharacterized protein YndB with AHSA1/START domain